MKKYIFIGFILLAMLLSVITVAKTSYKRRVLIDLFVSDSDTVLTQRTADSFRDSTLIIGGLEQGVQIQVWLVFFGDTGSVRYIWYYGHDLDYMKPETLLDTTVLIGDTLNKILTVTNWKTTYGSFMMEDSIEAGGDSVKGKVIEYEQ